MFSLRNKKNMKTFQLERKKNAFSGAVDIDLFKIQNKYGKELPYLL